MSKTEVIKEDVKIIDEKQVKKMEDFNLMLGSERELHILKGQLLNPVILSKKDGSGHYMSFRLKTLKQISNDEYSQRNNMFQIIVSEEKAKKFGSAFFREVKNQEVIVLVDVSNMTKKGNTGSPVYFNNTSYYLIDIMKTRDITKKEIALQGVFQEI